MEADQKRPWKAKRKLREPPVVPYCSEASSCLFPVKARKDGTTLQGKKYIAESTLIKGLPVFEQQGKKKLAIKN